MKSKKDSKNNKLKQPLLNEVGGEQVENVSYFQLYRYSNGKEKLMIFVGILGALLQGATLPFM
ncbi:hypothetical protein U3516DRAFT_914087 [Neocallimastix sp. 'constans']